MPVGSDKEAESDFQLIAGINRDLGLAVRIGRFREDLLARLDLWTFRLPGLRDRKEDIEPNLGFELYRHADEDGRAVSFNKEARRRYLDFATSPEAEWSARAQLSAVLEICRKCSSLSAAGRQLFAASRQAKSSSNDADRLRKYLARFGLDWGRIQGRQVG